MPVLFVHEIKNSVELSFVTSNDPALHEKQLLTEEQFQESQKSFIQIEKENNKYVIAPVKIQLDNNDNTYRVRIHNTVVLEETDIEKIPWGIPIIIQIPGADFSKEQYKVTDLLSYNNTTSQDNLFNRSIENRQGNPYFFLYRKVGSDELYIGSDFKILFYNVEFTPIEDSLIQYVKQIDPNYIGWGKFKVPLVQQLNPNDSFSYTDIQLDLITAIVTEMLELNPALKNHIVTKFSKYTIFKEMFDNLSIFKLRPEEDLVVKFGEVKTHVREVQQDWYNKKDTLQNT